MEGDEMEMSKEELQRWIRAKVKNSCLICPDVLKKGNALQLLLERREKQAARLLKLCESVAACEVIVKKQYSLLGLEYRDTDSDDDDKSSGCGHLPPSPCESTHSETQVRFSPAANSRTTLVPKRPDSENLNRHNPKKSLMKRPVVVLTRLPEWRISALCPLTPPNYSEGEVFGDSDCDQQWEPVDDPRNSDFSVTSLNSGPKKRRKMHQKLKEKVSSGHETHLATINTDPKSSAAQTSAPLAGKPTEAEENSTKTLKPPANTKGEASLCIISASSQAPSQATEDPPRVPQGEVSMNMTVLARRRAMSWQRGKIMEILSKEDGRLKYKVNFEGKKKSLVSGHHIAFVTSPNVEHLFVGARVVVKCDAEQRHFCPAVLAELACKKNQHRFLVFIDDQTPVYVTLYSIRLVCRPLADPLDDIVDDTHRNFMKEYMKSWPFQPLTQFLEGKVINAEYNGFQQECTVLEIDCSLVQVIFQDDQHREWLYRGSSRLERVIIMKQQMELKKAAGQKNSPTSGN
ncbi:histone-lysine N-methyltransferase SETDB1-A isoform X2 [Scophthalmus maximus]|nr:histone-lysine N-methyltransferase SETDB1-A isoform X2 [Scophthalmus maximus]XP_035476360.2 histone-lysine N-methyltransferase SETDB1-A isoform X2 [Scophthalmus maximus]XP_035476362.2 histone-lysine N-methyltransferase SETDB1-A isoform X2 [Scophthalmus maximus]XP_035476363.2 histone-lysine N-methyltransferase SETDB1-A isoform X2 [Scophthalmus maximus]